MKKVNCVNYSVFYTILFAAMLAMTCTHSPLQLSGGGSDTEVSGKILAADGTARAGVIVSLISPNYNPVFDGNLPSKMIVRTDTGGNYHFDSLNQGVYNVLAELSGDGTKILVNSIVVDSGIRKIIPDALLKKTATLIVWLPDSLTKQSGYIAVPGTFLWKAAQLNIRGVEFDSVPQGKLTDIVFQQTSDSSAVVLFHDVVVASSDTITLTPWAAWTHSAKVLLNTTASGANISQNVVDFPALVRLNSGNFNFSQAKPNGEDMRFIKTNNSALSFEIEDWDSASATATIWVKIDTIYGNDSRYFTMLWGNSSAKANSNPSAVFDTANGFQGVWHLGESGGTTQKDATYHNFIGTPEAMSGSSDVAGIIARGQDFDGSSQCISVLNARNSRLDVQTDSFYTVSSWVFARTLNNGLHVFLSKGSAQYGLMINKANRWEFYGGLAGYGVDTTTTAPATGQRLDPCHRRQKRHETIPLRKRSPCRQHVMSAAGDQSGSFRIIFTTSLSDVNRTTSRNGSTASSMSRASRALPGAPDGTNCVTRTSEAIRCWCKS
jgi:hypothetical protein